MKRALIRSPGSGWPQPWERPAMGEVIVCHCAYVSVGTTGSLLRGGQGESNNGGQRGHSFFMQVTPPGMRRSTQKRCGVQVWRGLRCMSCGGVVCELKPMPACRTEPEVESFESRRDRKEAVMGTCRGQRKKSRRGNRRRPRMLGEPPRATALALSHRIVPRPAVSISTAPLSKISMSLHVWRAGQTPGAG